MKRIIFTLLASAAFLFSCESTRESSGSVATIEPQEEVIQLSEGVVLWPALVVRNSAADGGKYVTSIYQGEKLIMLGESIKDPSSKNENVYTKIRLSDGTEGWVLERFIAKDGLPAAVQLETPVYKRPDLLTKSDKIFNRMDFVAVLDKSDDWIQVIGVPSGSTWFAEGWIKADKVTLDAIDISFAVLANRALSQEDEEKKNEELKELMANVDLQDAIFFNDLVQPELPEIDKMPEEEVLVSDDSSDSTTTEAF